MPEAYIPYTLAGSGFYHIFVRTTTDPRALEAAISKQVLTLDRRVIPQNTRTLEDVLEVQQYARPRFGLILFAVFAGIGVLLVTVGVYGVVSYSVTQQRQEIGIRIALGASGKDVQPLVLGDGLRLIAIGIAIGTALAAVTARALANQIWGIAWYDPWTLASVIALLACVGLLASYLPSMRATRVDPAICLRSE